VKKPAPRSRALADLVPPLAGLALVALFVALGFWQLDRAAEKRALAAAFTADSPPRAVTSGLVPAPFEHLAARGRYLAERQFLIDNIVQDGRLGYYVITPLELASGGPLLLVNRGWVARSGEVLPAVRVSGETRSVTGRAGRLPRVGLRPGEAFVDDAWPRLATFPTPAEIASALGRDLLPFVLLADPDPDAGMLRHWAPEGIGPGRHLAYAFQWFALAATVVAVFVVLHLRRRRAR
jgi:surfeit locus 1 family protein